MLPLVDDILNLAGLLLWLSWRSTRFDPLVRTSASSLAGTLRRAEPQRWKGWQFLAAVVSLVAIRALFYWQISEGVNWIPKLDLVAVVPQFNSDYFLPTLLYSVLSLARVLVVFYFWLLFLVVLNRHAPDSNPVQKMLRLHVGRVARWPWPVQLVLPVLLVAILWFALHPVLMKLEVSPASSSLHLLGQGLLIGSPLFLSLKYLLPPFLLLYTISSYVYLGASPFWDFVASTARTMLAPLRALPLRLGRLDFAPLVGIALVLLLLEWLPRFAAYELTKHALTLWPQ